MLPQNWSVLLRAFEHISSVRLDPFSPEQRRRVMQAVARKDTGPELKLRRALWRKGLRYRLHRGIAGTRPDLCFMSARIAVFVDGCFWHGCPKHYSPPVNNAAFWRLKLDRNQARDRRQDRLLREAGWEVMRYWECEVASQLVRAVHEIKQHYRLRLGGPC